jgi:hypothetical protein
MDIVPQIKQLFFQDHTRKDIMEMEEVIKNLPTAFDKCPYPIFHSFSDGMYRREIHINGGHLIVGKIHKKDYFVEMLTGKAWVVSEFGAKELIAPCSFKAKAGVKHIGFHLEDTIWVDTHRVEATTVEEAEKEIFADSYEDLDQFTNTFESMCSDIGKSQEEVRELSEIEEDIIPQPECDKVEIKDSPIEGKGVFVTEPVKKDNVFALARILNNRTPVGRYTNHSDEPNATGIVKDNLGMLVALRDIEEGEEITVNYREIVQKAQELDRSLSCQVG